MAKTPDYSALARDYLNMMQQQMAGTFTQPQFIEAMLAALQAMDPRKHPHARAKPHTATAPAAQPDAIIRLEQRLAKLEQQLATLSEQLAVVSGTAKPRRSRPAAMAKPAAKPKRSGTAAKPKLKPRKR